MSEMLIVKNDGPQIIETNYFDSTLARRGAFYMSINAGAFRLLVPPSHEQAIADFQAAREVIISRGTWQEREALEILFDDHTDEPYSIHIGTNQIERLPPASDAGKAWQFSAWIRKAGELQRAYVSTCHYRVVKALPYLKPLGK